MNNIAQVLKAEISNEYHIAHLLDDAAYTERFLSKPKPPKAPMMFDLITTSYLTDKLSKDLNFPA